MQVTFIVSFYLQKPRCKSTFGKEKGRRNHQKYVALFCHLNENECTIRKDILVRAGILLPNKSVILHWLYLVREGAGVNLSR